MEIGKKFFKNTIKGSIVFNLIIVFLFIVTTNSFVIAFENTKKNTGGIITDIGALGVPMEFVPYFNEASSIFNIPNWCLAAIAKQESNFNPNSSYGGAYGIMQVQKVDSGSGKDLWKYLIDTGLGQVYNDSGYKFSSADDMWNIYLKDPKAQIIGGSYEIRYYTNYVLYRTGKVPILDYKNNENMKIINWNANENDTDFKNTLRRIFACYNGGPTYGMSVNLDNAQFNYPNKVFQYAMEFRNSGLSVVGSEAVEKIIAKGMPWVGKSPYVWGGGRTQDDVDKGRFDCSSFVHYCYTGVGIQLGDRSSVTTFSLINLGEKINPKDMKRGDIIFFDTYTTNGHVGIYLGNGEFINDNSSKGVWIDNLNNPYWKSVFNGEVRRVVK